jgi:hypothetical protein
VNTEKTKYVVYRHKSAEQTQKLLIGNKSCENAAKFKYQRTTVTIQNCIHEDIKNRLNLGNGCYNSVQNLFSLLL